MKTLIVALLFFSSFTHAHNLVANSILERQTVLTKEINHSSCQLREITLDQRLNNTSSLVKMLSAKGYKFDEGLIMPDQPLFNNAFILFADETKVGGIKVDIILPAQKGILSYFGNLVINLEDITTRESFKFGGHKNLFEVEQSVLNLIKKLPRCVIKK